ncbi:MAG TPA: molybdopterin-guanine dinucleotide biosynthesis protein B [Gemmatimonadales bacterium]|nr:molybdopterin-guanine dinucleotide biosynthesis protein B [Gemmatimonadales bacterium]
MAATRILSIVGRKNSGKTTLAVALAAEYVRRGKRVMTIKHATHPADVDTPGTDSYRHFHEGRAERVLIASPELRVVFERSPDDQDPIALAQQYLHGADIVLVEGFTASPLPKIEVFRTAVAKTPLYTGGSEAADQWLAVVTDGEFEADCRVLRFRDTMWLQFLANIGWDGARIIGP